MPSTTRIVFSAIAAITNSLWPLIATATDSVTFNRDVRPILSEHCFECHGPDADNRQGELRLDIEAEAKLSAIKTDDASNSPVWHRIMSDDPDEIMPPPDAKKALSKSQIETLRQWINAGAHYEQHWSFMPIQQPKVPVTDDAVSNEIDSFINRRLHDEGLTPSPRTDAATLLRRVTLDLTGLPPTPDELQSYLNDKSQEAFARVVQRLLNSKHYGEHMALPWLEAARYADTSGYQADWERFMWPWRRWVIDAFNDNMPFDQFTIEQLAGDMLPNASFNQVLATGFNRNHRINDEGGVIAAEYAVEYVVDRIDTTSTVWLGLTMGCCRCHDHKYDPLPQQDFYNMFALFNNVPEKGKDGRPGFAAPIIDFPNPEVTDEISALTTKHATAVKRIDEAALAAHDQQSAWERRLRGEVAKNKGTLWRLTTPASVTGTGGVKFMKQDDQSYLRDGKNPAKTTYSILLSKGEAKSAAERGLTAIRVEALTDPSLTGGSLAKSANGNFVLSELRAEVLRGKEAIPQTFRSAVADHSQDKYPAANVIDGKSDTGWAVDGQSKKEQRKLVAVLSETYEYQDGDRIRIQLQHSSQYGQHAIGRFRISTTSAAAPTLDGQSTYPEKVVTALQTETPSDSQKQVLRHHYAAVAPVFKQLRADRDALQKKITELKKRQFVKVMVMSEMENPRETFVLTRGLYDQPNTERPATPDAPTIFGGLEGYEKNRLGFAKWLVAKDNPLTARVTVNRFWQQFFGRGLVETVEDFGSQGALPSHPELLNWLASDFRNTGWDIKELVRKIVTSDAYQRSSIVHSEHLQKDPKNLFLARAPRVRLSGYQLRDQALAASGLLIRKIGGPSVLPYQPPGLWSEVSFQAKGRRTDFYTQDHGDKLYRRGLYTFWKRSVAPPMLANFDAAGREMCTVRQTRTSTPLQALNLMNDVTFIEAARGMAQRMMKEGGTTPAEQITFGLSLVGIANPQTKLPVLQAGYEHYLARFRNDAAATTEFLTNGEWNHDASLNQAQLAALNAVASVILNLDEVVVRQ